MAGCFFFICLLSAPVLLIASNPQATNSDSPLKLLNVTLHTASFEERAPTILLRARRGLLKCCYRGHAQIYLLRTYHALRRESEGEGATTFARDRRVQSVEVVRSLGSQDGLRLQARMREQHHGSTREQLIAKTGTPR
jgi:hypothetical protein